MGLTCSLHQQKLGKAQALRNVSEQTQRNVYVACRNGAYYIQLLFCIKLYSLYQVFGMPAILRLVYMCTPSVHNYRVTSGVVLYHSPPPYYFEAGPLTKAGARLGSSKTQRSSCLCP